MSDPRQPQQFRFCTACGAEHAIGARYCGRCGSAFCPACGATVRRGIGLCPRCGKAVSSQAAPPSPPTGPRPSPRGPLPVSQPLFPAGASPWLVEFVDRQEILLAFQRLLAGTPDARRIILLHGASGIGKSSLLRRMQFQCRQERIPHALLELADARAVEDIKIMRDVRDSLGEEKFTPFTDLLNHYTKEGYALKLQVEVLKRDDQPAGGVVVQGQVEGVVAGRDVIEIRDNYLSAPRRDIEIDPRSMQDALTDRFMETLISLCSRQRVVCLFDDIDRLDQPTAYWFWHDFLEPLVNQTNFLAVLTATTAPPIERWVYTAIDSAALSNLPERHVAEYLERRGVPQTHREGVMGYIMSEIGGYGHPKEMERMVDIYLKERRGGTL